MKNEGIIIPYNTILENKCSVEYCNDIALNSIGKIGVLYKRSFLLLDSNNKPIETYPPPTPHNRVIRSCVDVEIGGWGFVWKNTHGSRERGVLVLDPRTPETHAVINEGWKNRLDLSHKNLVMKDSYIGLLHDHCLPGYSLDETMMRWSAALYTSGVIDRRPALELFLLMMLGSAQDDPAIIARFADAVMNYNDTDYGALYDLTRDQYPIIDNLTLRSVKGTVRALGILSDTYYDGDVTQLLTRHMRM